MEDLRIFTMHTEGGCYGAAHWLRCCAGILAEGVVGCMTSGAMDPLQSDSYPQSSAALHLSIQTRSHAHTQMISSSVCSAVGKWCVFSGVWILCFGKKKQKNEWAELI